MSTKFIIWIYKLSELKTDSNHASEYELKICLKKSVAVSDITATWKLEIILESSFH